MKRIALISFIFFSSFYLSAQAPQSWTSADIYQGVKKLNVLGSVLYVAAHPDDENTRLIAYFSREKLYRTGYLSMTRGDGGQNLIGDEQGIELGLIRTQELLSARRIDGGEQFFTRAYDFGYSKNPGETFAKWDKEKILSDVVWVIRKFQPDVIITRFPVTGEGGHGHHTASAILANDAFAAAADSNRFADHFKYGVRTWQPKRILWNSFNFGNTNLTSPDQFKFDVGGYNPLLGKGYGEIAAESRSQHKSQGFGVPAGRGEALEYFTTTGGPAPAADIFDGVDISWNRVKGGEGVQKIVDSLVLSFDFIHPEKSVKGLLKLYAALGALENGYWKNKKREEVKTLIEQCSGLFLDATTNNQFAVQTDSIRINFFMNNRLGADIRVKNIVFENFDTLIGRPLDRNKNMQFPKTFFVPVSKPVTSPYWLKENMQEGYFTVNNQYKIGQPDVDEAFRVKFNLLVEGTDLSYERAVKYKFTDPVRGELYQPVFVIPAITVLTSPGLVLFKDEQKEEKEIIVQANANKPVVQKLDIELNAGDTIYHQKDELPYTKYQTRNYSFTANNYSRFINVKESAESKKRIDSLIKPARQRNPDLKTPDFSKTGRRDTKATYYGFIHEGDSSDYYLGIRAINYDHIPSIKYFYPDAINVVNLSLKTYGKKIGYIVGAGDKVPEALEQMGYEVTLLGDKELSRNNLQQFDAILTGVRAYNTNEWMNKHYEKLMKYVEQGGNLIVQYNTSNFISSVSSRIGPYPFTINRNRITDEKAPVKISNVNHPVFTFPNLITEEDFTGWVQERSIYHATDTTGKYEKLISMNDPGEKGDDGSLLVGKYGKGYFTYTGLVFFRQLPAGVPGAYRLLANLIALNRKKAF
jgi:LmbE family N-acetylglucosaminyl deacetylase